MDLLEAPRAPYGQSCQTALDNLFVLALTAPPGPVCEAPSLVAPEDLGLWPLAADVDTLFLAEVYQPLAVPPPELRPQPQLQPQQQPRPPQQPPAPPPSRSALSKQAPPVPTPKSKAGKVELLRRCCLAARGVHFEESCEPGWSDRELLSRTPFFAPALRLPGWRYALPVCAPGAALHGLPPLAEASLGDWARAPDVAAAAMGGGRRRYGLIAFASRAAAAGFRFPHGTASGEARVVFEVRGGGVCEVLDTEAGRVIFARLRPVRLLQQGGVNAPWSSCPHEVAWPTAATQRPAGG